MELSALKLVMAKGPREGETLEFRPGSKIRLGRVVRGNDLPIKDDGISSKHLVIESESGKWALRDLGSSNGTLVNGAKVLPETPLELSDGDEIKIGELTSITVKVDGYEESRVRRNPRRGAAAAAPIAESRGRRGKVGAKESEPEKEKGDEVDVVEKRRGGRPPKARVLKSEVEPLPVPAEENLVRPVSTRRTRSSKNEGLGRNGENSGVGGGEGLKMEPRRTRGYSRRRNVPEGELPASDEVNIPELRVMGGGDGVKLEPKSTCGGSRRKNVEVGDSIRIDGENDQASKGLNFGQEVHEEGRGSGDKGGNSNGSSSGVKESVDKDIDGNGSGSGVGKGGDKDGSANASTSGVKESVDLEKMTMGEWFDFLEVYLVKQINDETEEAIAEMKEKAKRTQEYLAEQKKQGNMHAG